ncbi:uncharacterized protein YndB with AHSA1/START domain [Bosea sp. BE125]|uniref:SRPBCC family protein n=1 Tax=Bosea sp. BE125 TaxID=2817909 RepID=UPI002861A767|nr:SRPBCC domain-containing protein [Bosea sp. BE125]MDR6871392.1 uncharacterized protein YndB with AHSA1/START domain [Bosea sp. BE125]
MSAYGWPDFHPLARMSVEVDPAILSIYAGLYELTPTKNPQAMAEDASQRNRHTVHQSIRITAAPGKVWAALVASWAGETWRNADFETDWQIGSPIAITARIGAKRYRDKGRVIRVEPYDLLQYAYWSRISGLPDVPSSYSTITFKIVPEGDQVLLEVEQDVPPSPLRHGKDWSIGPESGFRHVEFYWRSTLPILKHVVEQGVAI